MRIRGRCKSIPVRKTPEQIEQEAREQVVSRIQGFVPVPHSGIHDPWATAERWARELRECDWLGAHLSCPSKAGIYRWMLDQLLCGKLSPSCDDTGGWQHLDLRHHEFMQAWLTHRSEHVHCPVICQSCSNKNLSEAQPLCALNLKPISGECDGFSAVVRAK